MRHLYGPRPASQLPPSPLLSSMTDRRNTRVGLRGRLTSRTKLKHNVGSQMQAATEDRDAPVTQKYVCHILAYRLVHNYPRPQSAG